jgi:hypothetical protein
VTTLLAGVVTNMPTSTDDPSAATVADPTGVQWVPSTDASAVSVLPVRVSRSPCGSAGSATSSAGPMSPVKSYCSRTPWPPVSITAAYEDPCAKSAFTIRPALAHGLTSAALAGPSVPASRFGDSRSPTRSLTRAVMLPSPSSCWWTK